MKLLGISGSPVKRGSYYLLNEALKNVEEKANTEILHILDYNLQNCRGCNSCLKKDGCEINDDLELIVDKLKTADAIIIASPNHFASVSTPLKKFMNRTRYLKMNNYQLKNKYLGAIVTSGLDHGGGQSTVDTIHRFGLWHGMYIVGPLGKKGKNMVIGTLESKTGWRKIKDDNNALRIAKNLSERLLNIV